LSFPFDALVGPKLLLFLLSVVSISMALLMLSSLLARSSFLMNF